ncbi:RNA ligase family protein [Microtetraspora niveoalba]|uniref:RNA ligase family protein n=1 Tax=Microtetraspora niveoalba TaxID=46175 RepID=UPI000832FD5F|nr:RNA ligase family protein [Microtetraspora niveoalba]
MRVHYPRTPHLPWSPGATADDVRAGGLSGLVGREVVVTEKLDGENTTMYADGVHARSLDSAHHPSRAWVKALHGRIARSIPPGWRVCGENLYARHSVEYPDLESWFYAFSVWDGDHCLAWDPTVRFARRLGVPVPPVLWRGVFDERALRALRLDTARCEGYVVRTVEGFRRQEFAHRVAKWVRPAHVRTGEHWMLAPVVANGLGPAAALWEVRSGSVADVPSLLTALGMTAAALHDPFTPGPARQEPDGPDSPGPEAFPPADPGRTSPPATAPRSPAVSFVRSAVRDAAVVERAETAVAEVTARLDVLGRTGDARLAGVLAALFGRTRRAWLAPRLVAPLGMGLARRVADLVGLHARLRDPFPDERRRPGLVRLAEAADLGVLHAVAAALAGSPDDGHAEAREQIAWSELHAEDAGLLGEEPLRPLGEGLRAALGGCDPDVADRCWAEARDAYARGGIATPEEAVASSWRWRSGRFPRLVVMVGPSGSGKSTLAGEIADAADAGAVVSLDDLRAARGSRSDQRANPEILTEGLRRLDTLLSHGGTIVWDATSLNRRQRGLVHAVARRRDALTTHAVMLVTGEELARRNAVRADRVPPEVLAAQTRRFDPPFPWEAHRTWYAGPDGRVHDTAGTLGSTD